MVNGAIETVLWPGARDIIGADAVFAGVYADKPGYHNSRNRLLARGLTGDYSIQTEADKQGPGDLGSAIDITFKSAQGGDYRNINKYCKRLYQAGIDKDPRTYPLREFFGNTDADTEVEGWSYYRNGPRSSDPSHAWHIHLSIWRKYINDAEAMRSILSILKGEPALSVIDVRSWARSLFATLDLPGDPDGWMQDFVVTGANNVFNSQGWTQTDGIEDVVLTFHDNVGGAFKRMGSQRCHSAGHGAVISYLGGGRFVFNYAGRLSEITFDPDKDIPGPSSSLVKPWGGAIAERYKHADIDPAGRTALLLRVVPGVGSVFDWRTLDDLATGTDRVLGTVGPIPGSGPVYFDFQGMAHRGNTMFYLSGQSWLGQQLRVYDLKTGNQVYMINPFRLAGPSGIYQEPENLFYRDGELFVGYTTRAAGSTRNVNRIYRLKA